MTTKIEWTHPPGYKGESWNPLRGCSVVSSGCTNCYAMKQAIRHDYPGGAYEGLTNKHGVWNGNIKLVPEKLDEPLRRRKPTCYFVNSMSDLFHENVPDEYIDKVFAVMALCPKHRFIVLTKRPERMRDYINETPVGIWQASARRILHRVFFDYQDWPLPLQNVLLGVSVENQETADERIPLLLETPAACRVVSYEPALGPVVFERPHQHWLGPASQRRGMNDGLDWIIVGGESGHGARPFDIQWARSVISQCKIPGVPLFVKQLGTRAVAYANEVDQDARSMACSGEYDPEPTEFHWKDRKGGDMDEWPEDLRVREWPEVLING